LAHNADWLSTWLATNLKRAGCAFLKLPISSPTDKVWHKTLSVGQLNPFVTKAYQLASDSVELIFYGSVVSILRQAS
jgi:hypothetical protein